MPKQFSCVFTDMVRHKDVLLDKIGRMVDEAIGFEGSGGEAFSEANIGLTDITQLAPDISDEENDEEEEEEDDDNEQEQEQGAAGGSAAGAGNCTAKAKAKNKEKEQEEQIWFERDRKLNAAYKTLDATYK